MIKSFLVLAVLLLNSVPVWAQSDEILTPEVQKALDETNLAMQKSAYQVDQAVQKIVPQLTESVSQMMNDIFKTLPPLMSAMEKNQVFSKATQEMNRQFQQSLQEVNKNIDNLPVPPAQQPQEANQFSISGSRNDNGNILSFVFSQDNKTLNTTRQALDYKTSPAPQNPDIQLVDINNQKIDVKKTRYEIIDGNKYIVFSPDSQNAFITGNLQNQINLKVQTSGPDALKRAKQFVTNFRSQYLK